jgi:hypothetical protein
MAGIAEEESAEIDSDADLIVVVDDRFIQTTLVAATLVLPRIVEPSDDAYAFRIDDEMFYIPETSPSDVVYAATFLSCIARANMAKAAGDTARLVAYSALAGVMSARVLDSANEVDSLAELASTQLKPGRPRALSDIQVSDARRLYAEFRKNTKYDVEAHRQVLKKLTELHHLPSLSIKTIGRVVGPDKTILSDNSQTK